MYPLWKLGSRPEPSNEHRFHWLQQMLSLQDCERHIPETPTNPRSRQSLTNDKGEEITLVFVASDMASNSCKSEVSDTAFHFSTSVIFNASVVRLAISARKTASSCEVAVLVSIRFFDLCSTVEQHGQRSVARAPMATFATAAATASAATVTARPAATAATAATATATTAAAAEATATTETATAAPTATAGTPATRAAER